MIQASAADEILASNAGVPGFVIAAIRQIESSGNPRAVRFETRLFRERTGQTIEGTSRSVFQQAYAINPRAAVESTSWGLYQVLGGIGLHIYSTPAEFVAAFDREPVYVSEQLLVEWFRRNRSARNAANEGNWATLAERYNGQSRGPWYNRFVSLVGDVQSSISALPTSVKVVRAVALAALLFTGWQLIRVWRGK